MTHPVAAPVRPQKILNGEVHDWYRIILGYSDHLVSQLIDRFKIQEGDWVLDPFCGSGTTLVECLKRGINAVGIDANPSSCFAAQVKVDWTLGGRRLRDNAAKAKLGYLREIRTKHHLEDPTYLYLHKSGFIYDNQAPSLGGATRPQGPPSGTDRPRRRNTPHLRPAVAE